MDIGSIFLLLGILILVAVFISRPFFYRRNTLMLSEEHNISSLLSERERIINALMELDFDHNLGKIPAEDYPTQRANLLARGADVMQQLDLLRPQGIPHDFDAQGETPSKTGKGDSAGSREPKRKRVIATPDDDLEELLAARRRERGEKAGGFCSQCGYPVQISDRFCPKCGEPLYAIDESQK